MDIVELVKNAKKGDKDALFKLISGQKQEYFKLAYVYMEDREDAMDAVEDMTLILYENIHKLKNGESFYSWSKTILVNCCKNNLKKRKKVIPVDKIPEQIYEESFSQKDEGILLEEHLSKLNFKHQEIIRLRYYLDMDYQAIADILKIPKGTVKSRISIGLEKLKKSLGGENCEKS